jgi:hypothetical protein
LQARLDVLYEDRLDRRIDASMYDAKSGQIRQELGSIRNRIWQFDEEKEATATEALDLMTLTSRAAELFLSQSVTEQRRFLHLLVREAQWKGGELRMSFLALFERIRLSNSATYSEQSEFSAQLAKVDNWRATVDAFLAESRQYAQQSNRVNEPSNQQLSEAVSKTHSSRPSRRDTSRTGRPKHTSEQSS